MIGSRQVAVILLAIFTCAVPLAIAQEAEKPGPEKVSIRAAVDAIAKRGNVNILLHEDVEGEVTPPLPSLPMRDQIRHVEVEARVEVWPLGEETFFVLPGKPLTIEFDNLPAIRALRRVAEEGGMNLVAPRFIGKKVSIETEGSSLRAVLDDIIGQSGLVVIEEPGRVMRFALPEDEERLENRPLSKEALSALGLGQSEAKGKDRVSLDVTDAKPADVIRTISDTVGIRIELGQGDRSVESSDQPLTLKIVDAPWKEAVRAIAWMMGGHVRDDGKGNVEIRSDPRLTMDFEEASVPVVLELMARLSPVSIDVAEGLEIPVDVVVGRSSPRDFLYALSRAVPFDLEVKPDGTLLARPF